jgi:hypothetical protein
MANAAGLRMRFWRVIAASSCVPGHLWDSIGLGGRHRGRETQNFLLKFRVGMEQQRYRFGLAGAGI